MKKILFLIMIIGISCANDEDIHNKWTGNVTIVNENPFSIYIGSLVNEMFCGTIFLRSFKVESDSIRIVNVVDGRNCLYSQDPRLQLVYNLEYLGFCLYTSDITNENIGSYPTNSYWIGLSYQWHKLRYLGHLIDPGQQYIPPSLIYREQITTNETLPDGRYPWEVPTNTRPFYLVLASNTIVVTSVMTNVTN